jgi:hypothetical protein
MNKYTFIPVLLFCSCTQSKHLATIHVNSPATLAVASVPSTAVKQFEGTDTIGYLKKQIITNKAKYLNKPLGVLLSDLDIAVASYQVGPSASDIRAIPNITLSFTNSNVTSDRIYAGEHAPLLYIEFEKPASMEAAAVLIRANKNNWTDAEKKYYEGFIVKDVFLSHFFDDK